MSEKNQVVVVGAGPGGYAAAFLAARHGFATTLIDPDVNPGGVCLHRGCIPSKALLHVAKLITTHQEAEKIGLNFSTPVVDLPKIRSWKQEVVARLTRGLGNQCQQRGVKFIRGMARFLDNNTLEVDNFDGGKQKLSFKHAILATGSRPSLIPGLDHQQHGIMDSTQALELETIPSSLLVVGGGNIGLELGTVYAALGSMVSIVEMTNHLLPGADRDMVRPVAQKMARIAQSIQTNTRITQLHSKENRVHVTLQKDETSHEEIFERVLIAIGRTPNGDKLSLENTDVVLDRGCVQVGPDMRTSVKNILAIGDLIGGPMLAHKASWDAKVAINTLLGKPAPTKKSIIPSVTYTDPELAYAGLTETQARKQGIKVKAARFPWAASGRAHTLERTDGTTKWVVDPKTERILGVGMCGYSAGELIAQGVMAIEQGLTIKDITETIFPHPTLSETLLEAADVFMGESVHYYAPKRDR